MAAYVARLCWNSENWTRPTGESAKAEHRTYATRVGYGHEEWLLNFQWVLEGWKYGFLQPVNRSYAKVCGRTIDVLLYRISDSGDWFYVGRIPTCEVVTPEQAEIARKSFRNRTWLKDMEAHVKSIGGHVEGLRSSEPQLLFNVRFHPGDIELYDPMIPVPRTDALRSHRRYTLVELTGKVARSEAGRKGRTGTVQLRPTDRRPRRASGDAVVDLVHNQLQNELFTVLRRQFGKASVIMEEGFADVKLCHLDAVHLFEVKSDPRPRRAIREGMGQLLEYAFTCHKAGEKVGLLVVAAPGELNDRDREYLGHLKNDRGLDIEYLCLRRGMPSIGLSFESARHARASCSLVSS